ncbi:hypothetical protein PCASD_11107 [Puccinia coronata f. sp. avenae]|uniref:Uncharacterized protein n=1 Tax=Puccinia coronata f. sp. avenae TaxID=200324 RepID=A0A2N5TBA2_9BASI|nr:hypothetical protein PCASD_11107 [Puccinia coronata f. sp. avenae]
MRLQDPLDHPGGCALRYDKSNPEAKQGIETTRGSHLGPGLIRMWGTGCPEIPSQTPGTSLSRDQQVKSPASGKASIVQWRALPAMLARMVASEFTSDAAIRFKLRRRATKATEFESVNDSLGGPAPEFESDGRIRYKLGCNHPSQLFWQWCHWALDGTTAFAYFLITPTHNTHHKTQPIPCTPPSADIQLHLRESAPPGFDMASTPHLTTHNLALLQSA